MDWIKVLNRHTIFEYTDLLDSEFVAWIKIMSLAALMEKEPTREQMLKYTHHRTLDSLQNKLINHSTTLHDVLMKVLKDAQEVVKRREVWKNNKKKYRGVIEDVSMDVHVDVSTQEKRREEKEKNIKKDNTLVDIPEWIKKETWDAFMEVRKKLKAPQTDTAIKLLISKLTKLKSSGQDPNEIINESISNGWRGVFPLKATGTRKPFTPPSGERDIREYQPEEIPIVSEEERKKRIETLKGFTDNFGRASP